MPRSPKLLDPSQLEYIKSKYNFTAKESEIVMSVSNRERYTHLSKDGFTIHCYKEGKFLRSISVNRQQIDFWIKLRKYHLMDIVQAYNMLAVIEETPNEQKLVDIIKNHII